MLVRRELAFNFVRYAKRVDRLEELPEWARATLAKHRDDPRDPVYTREQFEPAATCDDLWNATQKELLERKTGVQAYLREIEYLERTGKELTT